MPIHGYECRACGGDFETLVRADETVACPACGGTDLERQLSRIARPRSGDGEPEAACGMPAAAMGCGRCGMGGGDCG